MPAGSAASRESLLGAVDEAIEGGADAATVGAELFALVELLDAQPALRRALTDPAVDAEAKGRLVDALLSGKVSDETEQVVRTASGLRWSRGRDLADSLDEGGAVALLDKADKDGKLDSVEDELFRFARIVEGNPELRDRLADRRADLGAKRELVDSLLAKKVVDSTAALIRHALSGRGGQLTTVLQRYQELAASRHERLVAVVRVAAPLTAKQTKRLASALGEQYGKEIHLNVIVDPEVLGGVRVQIGDEVIDSTVASRLAEARRRLAG